MSPGSSPIAHRYHSCTWVAAAAVAMGRCNVQSVWLIMPASFIPLPASFRSCSKQASKTSIRMEAWVTPYRYQWVSHADLHSVCHPPSLYVLFACNLQDDRQFDAFGGQQVHHRPGPAAGRARLLGQVLHDRRNIHGSVGYFKLISYGSATPLVHHAGGFHHRVSIHACIAQSARTITGACCRHFKCARAQPEHCKVHQCQNS